MWSNKVALYMKEVNHVYVNCILKTLSKYFQSYKRKKPSQSKWDHKWVWSMTELSQYDKYCLSKIFFKCPFHKEEKPCGLWWNSFWVTRYFGSLWVNWLQSYKLSKLEVWKKFCCAAWVEVARGRLQDNGIILQLWELVTLQPVDLQTPTVPLWKNLNLLYWLNFCSRD